MSTTVCETKKKPAKKTADIAVTRVMDDDALLKIGSLHAFTGNRKAKTYQDIKEGLLPPPIRRSNRDAVWPLREIKVCCRAVAAGLTREQRRQVVNQLMQERAAMAQEFLAALMR